MRLKNSLLSTFKSFRRDELGSIAMGAGIGILTMVIAIGAATDYSRISHTKNIMADALDAAVLSSAKDLSEGAVPNAKFRKEFENFFLANLESRSKQTDRFKVTKFNADPLTGVVTAEVEANLQMAFMGIVGKDRVIIGLDSEVQFKSDEIELAMMLDVTGSMRGRKLSALQLAAKDAINILLPVSNSPTGKIRIGLVPYANSVNAGTYAKKATAVSSSSGNCSGNSKSGKYKKNSWKGKGKSKGCGNKSSSKSSSSSSPANDCVVERGGTEQYTETSYKISPIPTDDRADCPDVSIRPLTKNKKQLTKDIDKFVASGSTAGHLGIAWSYYMLSDKWKSLWPTKSDPVAYSNKVQKIALLMTDGEFNTFFYKTSGNPWGSSYSQQAKSSVKTALMLCEDMKKKKDGQNGIIVYSIAFSAPNSAKKTLKACASPDEPGNKHYFSADSETELREAFQQIAFNIQKLRLTK